MGRDGHEVLFDANPRPLWVVDRETLAFLAVNDAACRRYGWSRAEFLTMTLRDVRPPDARPEFEQIYAATKTSTTYTRLGRHWTKSGERFDVHLEVSHVTFQGREASLAVMTDVTDSSETERRFRLLVEHSADGISVTNPQHLIEYMSPGGLRMLGYPAEAIVGTTSELRVHPDDAKRWRPFALGETRTDVTRMRHADGSWRWLESSTTNLTHDPAVRAYVSNFHDITERVLAERAIRESQRRLEYLLSATSAITYTMSLEGQRAVTFMSANVGDILGYRPEAFSADPSLWRERVAPEDLERVERETERLLERGANTIDYKFRRADGGYRWMRDVARVVRDDTGKPTELVGYWIDVTEQHQAEELLRRSEKNFRTVIERTPTATCVIREGRYVYVNPAAVELLGYDTMEELVGRRVLDFIHPDDRERVRAEATRLDHGGTRTGEARMVRRDGSAFVLEAERIDMEFDGRRSAVVMGRDVTRQREMFARMALAERMLSVATLAAGVAHEINNPLAFVGTNVRILAAELDDLLAHGRSRLAANELRALAADAGDGVARVSAIVQDLRSLARPEDDQRGPTDVVSVLVSSIKMAHNEIRHRARVVESFEAGLPEVHGHASRLGQVFLNLLVNAAQAIEVGSADKNEIRVTARRASPDRVAVEITDTGRGISPSSIGRIFDPFYTTKDPGEGLGLGLAISHQIVSAMDGELTVESAPGLGSTFRVTLPVARREVPRPNRVRRQRAPARRTRPVHRRRGRARPLPGCAPGARDRGRRGDASARSARSPRARRVVRRDRLRSDDARDQRDGVLRAARRRRAGRRAAGHLHDRRRVHRAGSGVSREGRSTAPREAVHRGGAPARHRRRARRLPPRGRATARRNLAAPRALALTCRRARSRPSRWPSRGATSPCRAPSPR